MMYLQVITPRSAFVSVILVLYSQESPAEGCPKLLFGPRCQYLCHCRFDFCDVNGNCLDWWPCADGFFGPKCQYINALGRLRWQPPGMPPSMFCNTEPGDLYLSLLWPVPMTWMRIVTTKDVSKERYKFYMKLNGMEGCVNKRIYNFGYKNLDISCDNPFITSSVVLSGLVLDLACDIYFSYGRNVARHQNVSVFGTRGYTAGLIHPVDESFRCQTTENRKPSHDFTVRFDHLYLLHSVNVILAKDMLSNNTLTIKAYRGSTVVTSLTETGLQKDLVNRLLPEMRVVDRITIRTVPEIEVCEFQAFGDTWCGTTHYGLECENTCKCASSEICFTPTGRCEPLCASGKHGPDCSLNCGRGCINNTCDGKSGKCSCKPGFWNDSLCDTECGNPNSVCVYEQCSEHCLNYSCNNSSGKCDACAAGYEGPDCEAIKIACSEHCRNETCNETSGVCLHCAAGYEGPDCAAIQKVHCDDDKEGFGCEVGKTDSSTGYTFHHLLGAALILLLLAICIYAAWFFILEKRHVSVQEGNKETDVPKRSLSPASPAAVSVASRASIEEHGSEVDYNPADLGND